MSEDLTVLDQDKIDQEGTKNVVNKGNLGGEQEDLIDILAKGPVKIGERRRKLPPYDLVVQSSCRNLRAPLYAPFAFEEIRKGLLISQFELPRDYDIEVLSQNPKEFKKWIECIQKLR